MTDTSTYGDIYEDTVSMILMLAGLPRPVIEGASIELQIDYEMFCAECRGPYRADGYDGFTAMLSHWTFPWPEMDESSLNGLTLAQFYLARAWEQNEAAKYCLDGKAVADGWDAHDAIGCGVIAAVSAAKLVTHAKTLIVTSDDPAARTVQ